MVTMIKDFEPSCYYCIHYNDRVKGMYPNKLFCQKLEQFVYQYNCGTCKYYKDIRK